MGAGHSANLGAGVRAGDVDVPGAGAGDVATAGQRRGQRRPAMPVPSTAIRMPRQYDRTLA